MRSESAPEAPHGSNVLWKRLTLAAFSALLAFFVLEILVSNRAIPLSPAAGAYVHGCYEKSLPDRMIHASIRPLKVGIHRPGFEGDCYWLGHAWRHRSDAYGWRNPETWDTADIVLLGDSMIYGHGVEEDETAAAFLRGLTGSRVVNMGITGGSPVHYLAYVRNFALPLEPEVIVVFTFGNDLWDIRDTRPMSKIRRFVRTGRGREAKVLPRSELLADLRSPRHQPSFLDRFALHRLLEYHRKARQARKAAGSPGPQDQAVPALRPNSADAGRSGPLPPPRPTDAVLDKMERLFTLRYLRRAVATMAESSRQGGATLVVGHIGQRTHIDWAIRRALQQESAERGALYFDVPEFPSTYRLPRDGHFNAEGHRRLAETLAAFLTERKLAAGSHGLTR